MKKLREHWRLITSALCITLFAIFLFSASDAVNKCEKEEKNWRSQHRSQARPGWSTRLYSRVYVHVACAGNADDVWVALSGIAVAAFTFTLWRSTEKLWREAKDQRQAGEKAARIESWRVDRSLRIAAASATAAQLSADALAGVETARLELVGISLEHQVIPPGHIRHGWITVEFKNFGRTDARILFDRIAFQVCPRLPEQPEFPESNTLHAKWDDIVVPGEIWKIVGTRNGVIKLTDQEAADVWNYKADAVLWVYGEIAYRDFLNRKQVKKFCAALQRRLNERFVGPEYAAGYFVPGGPKAYQDPNPDDEVEPEAMLTNDPPNDPRPRPTTLPGAPNIPH